jgi:hypothetical protein
MGEEVTLKAAIRHTWHSQVLPRQRHAVLSLMTDDDLLRKKETSSNAILQVHSSLHKSYPSLLRIERELRDAEGIQCRFRMKTSVDVSPENYADFTHSPVDSIDCNLTEFQIFFGVDVSLVEDLCDLQDEADIVKKFLELLSRKMERTFKQLGYTDVLFLEHLVDFASKHLEIECSITCTFSVEHLRYLFPHYDTDISRYVDIECRIGTLGDVTIRADLLSTEQNNPDHEYFLLFGKTRMPLFSRGEWTPSLGRNASIPITVCIVKEGSSGNNASIGPELLAVSRVSPEDFIRLSSS